MSLILESDYKYFTPILKKVTAKRRSIICRSCKKRLGLLEEYVWFHTHCREILAYLGLKSTAKAPSLSIVLCIDCWLKRKEKLIELAGKGYEILEV